MKNMIRLSQKFYRFLLNFYPKSYRHEFGKEMQFVYSQSLKDAVEENGIAGVVNFWVKTAIDAAKSLTSQHLDNLVGKGGVVMKTKNSDLMMQNKIFGYIAAGTAFILSIPLIAMQFTSEVDWQIFDFVVMGTLIFGTGFIFVQIARITPKKYRILLASAFLTALLITWVHLAVGIVDTWPFAGS